MNFAQNLGFLPTVWIATFSFLHLAYFGLVNTNALSASFLSCSLPDLQKLKYVHAALHLYILLKIPQSTLTRRSKLWHVFETCYLLSLTSLDIQTGCPDFSDRCSPKDIPLEKLVNCLYKWSFTLTWVFLQLTAVGSNLQWWLWRCFDQLWQRGQEEKKRDRER